MFNSRVIYILLIPVLIVLNSCGGGKATVKEDANLRMTSYINHLPRDTQILNHNNPTFKFERNTNDTSSIALCSTLNTAMHDATLKVIKVGGTTNNTIQTVLEENIQVQNECQNEINFPSLILEENVGYAWRVDNPDVQENEDTQWQSFIYSPNSLGAEDSDPHACKNNLVADWTFTGNESVWQSDSVPLSTSSPTIVLANGHDDAGAGQFQSPAEVLYQNLSQPIVQGTKYQLKFSLQHQGKSDFQIKVLAFNNNLTSLVPNADTAIVAVTGTITSQNNNWVKVTLPAWQAINNFNSLAIVVTNDQGNVVSALIDRVCLSKVESSGCSASVDSATDLPAGFDFENSDPVITQHEYLAGSVNHLYPNYDTSSADWFEQANEDGALDCTSIGGDLTDEEEQEIDAEMVNPDLDSLLDDLSETRDTLLSNVDDADSNDPALELTPISNTLLPPEKCTSEVVDPSKPFSGRDIVYIHGLQLPALIGNLELPPRFQEKWPVDKTKFYSGGHIIERANMYWADHIKRELGANYTTTTSGTPPDPTTVFTSDPTNSFLVVSWSANQRTRFAIHAVLTQIRDAMKGTNPNVTFSKSGKEKEQCFGDNGIVVVTHSTGGLIASAMFGVAENSNNPAATITGHGVDVNIQNTFGDVRFLTEKIDAQIGINSAYVGSTFAEVALKKLTNLAGASLNNPVLDEMARGFFRNLLEEFNHSFGPQHIPILNQSSLADLIPQVAAERWRRWQASAIPTLTMSGTSLGKSVFSPNAGKKILTGFDDLVLTPSSQSNSYISKPRFKVKNRRKLNDKGVGKFRRRAQIKDGKKASGNGYRNYYNTPYIAPTGMLQGNSVDSVTDPTNWHIPNHHIVLQSTGDHFDNVNNVSVFKADKPKLSPYTNHYGMTKGNNRIVIPTVSVPFIHGDDEENYEETGVVFNSALYSTGLLSNNFRYLNDEIIRDETWGFNFVKVVWVLRKVGPIKIRLPKLTWHYYEYIKWQRKYNLLRGHETKIGADYLYEHILR